MSVLVVLLSLMTTNNYFRTQALRERSAANDEKIEIIAEEQRRRSEMIARSERLETQVREILMELREALKITPSDVYKLLQQLLEKIDEKNGHAEN